MFHPAVVREDLRQFPLRCMDRDTAVVEKDSAGAGGALIDTQNVIHISDDA